MRVENDVKCQIGVDKSLCITVLSDMSRVLVSRDVSDLYTLSLSHFIGSQDPCPLLPVNIYINI